MKSSTEPLTDIIKQLTALNNLVSLHQLRTAAILIDKARKRLERAWLMLAIMQA